MCVYVLLVWEMKKTKAAMCCAHVCTTGLGNEEDEQGHGLCILVRKTNKTMASMCCVHVCISCLGNEEDRHGLRACMYFST